MNPQSMIRTIIRTPLLVLLALSLGACVEKEVVYRQAPPAPVAEHPAYLHALSDLREARWLIQRRNGEGVANGDEQIALDEIGEAIGAIRHAAIDDGKDLGYQPPPDAHPNRPGRLHDALGVLRKVHSDLDREEDNGYAQGLRNRALQHVDAAAHATENAIRDLQSVE